MFMKHSLKNVKSAVNNFQKGVFRNFTAAAKPDTSISIRFHELYVKELQRIEKNT